MRHKLCSVTTIPQEGWPDCIDYPSGHNLLVSIDGWPDCSDYPSGQGFIQDFLLEGEIWCALAHEFFFFFALSYALFKAITFSWCIVLFQRIS